MATQLAPTSPAQVTDSSDVDQLVRSVLEERHGNPIPPDELHKAVASRAGDAVTFAEVRRAIWRLIGRAQADVTNDWLVFLRG